MRRYPLELALVALVALICLAPRFQEPPILRLHVVAHSDSAEDQAAKLAVRDALLQEFAPAGSIAEAENIVLHSGPALQAAAEAALREAGCGYGAQLQLGTFAFPERVYGKAVYPAGDYRALRVVLGAGAGQNWWCVLFPPLCILEEASADLPGDEIVFESAVVRWWRGN